MKKIVLTLILLTLVLVGCGKNKLSIDIENIQNILSERALEQKAIQEDGYTEEYIKLVKICEAMEKGKEDFGYDDYYLVYWQTSDKKYQRTFLMKDYELSHGDQVYDPVEDRCIDFND
jgi:uncharacterized protein YcfL